VKRLVINIERDKLRRDRTVEELASHGYKDFEIMKAVEDVDPKKGISMSFRKAIIENYQEPYLHIFEDDIMFSSKDSYRVFNDNMNLLPQDWDVYLGGSYEYKIDYKTKGFIKVLDFSSLHSVVIKKKAYDKILAHNYSIMDNIDRYMGYLSKNKQLNVFLCDPQVAIQYPGYSYQIKKNVNYTDRLRDKNILYDKCN
jgi:GR25 family glycosyltransferase involved in LPS biosynthesis